MKGDWINVKKGQTSFRENFQDVLFPMEILNITQGNNEGTHKGTFAIDNAGKDVGVDPIYAPVDMTLVAYDNESNGNAVFFQSDKKVRFADGSINYLTMMFIHDNDIKDILKTKHYKQGQKFGDEGIAGKATGNHCHMEYAKGKFTHMYDKNNFGVYHLPNNVTMENVCFMNGTSIQSGKADWRYLNDVSIHNSCPYNSFGSVKALYDKINVRTEPNTKKGYTGDFYNAGMILNYSNTLNSDGWWWAEYISRKGQTHYCALCKTDGTSKFWKQL